MTKAIKTGYISALLTLLFFMEGAKQACSCDMVLHSWQLKFYVKIPISAPLLPLSEVSILQNHFKEETPDKIIWLTRPSFFSPFLKLFIGLFDGWVSKAQWYSVYDSKSVARVARDFSTKESKPVILGSDKNFLKIAFFSDINSKNNCHQIVFAQNSRIRCIHQNHLNPWAQEFNMQSCFALAFYRLPLPGYIINSNIYPVNGAYFPAYLDERLVEELLEKKVLLPRPDLYKNPDEPIIPILPD